MAFFRNIPLAVSLAVILVVPSARAWSLFGSGDKTGKVLQTADRYMERADSEFEKGEFKQARDLFLKALDGYMQVEALAPDYKNGLATLRIQYCAAQMTNTVVAMAGGPVKFAEEVLPVPAAPPPRPQDRPQPVAAPVRRPQPVAPSRPVAAKAPAEAAPSIRPGTGVAEVPPSPPAAEVQAIPSVRPEAMPPRPDARNYIHDFNEARVLVEEGFLSEAIDLLVPLLRQDPGNRSIRLMIAIVRTRQGRFDEAIGALEDLRGRQEDLPILLAISGAYLGAGRYPDALLALDRAVKLAPDDPNAYLNLAWLSLVMPGCGRDAIPNAGAYYRQAILRGAARDRALEKRIGLTKW